MALPAFDVLADPVRRRILELLAGGERTSGGICEVIRDEFGISQPAVSAQLRVLPDGPRGPVECGHESGPHRAVVLTRLP